MNNEPNNNDNNIVNFPNGIITGLGHAETGTLNATGTYTLSGTIGSNPSTLARNPSELSGVWADQPNAPTIFTGTVTLAPNATLILQSGHRISNLGDARLDITDLARLGDGSHDYMDVDLTGHNNQAE